MMKKFYIAPSMEKATFRASALCADSVRLDDTTPVGGSGALTRELWADEEEQQ